MTSSSNAKTDPNSFKIFVGGLDLETTEEDLKEYFSKYGTVVELLIKINVKTKKSRGFGFVGFKSPESIDKVLRVSEHFLMGKKIDCKRAMTKEEAYSLNKNLKETCRKIYVSNIPKDVTKEEIHNFFSEFGDLDEVNLMFKKKETGFCYIVFKKEEDALNVINRNVVEIKGYKLEVKKAIPKDLKDGMEEETKSKNLSQAYQGPNIPKHRHSFDAPINYQSYYNSPVSPYHMGPSSATHSKYPPNYPYYGGQGANQPPPPRHMDRFYSSYERNNGIESESSQPSPFEAPTKFSPNQNNHKYSHYPPTGYGQHSPEPIEKIPHRSRVMSEQQIATYKQFQGHPAYQNPSMRPPPIASKFLNQPSQQRYYEDPRFVVESPGMPEHNKRFQSMADIQQEKNGPQTPNLRATGQRMSPPQKQMSMQEPKTDFNFYENKGFTLKAQFPKQSTSAEAKGGPILPAEPPSASSQFNRVAQLEEQLRQAEEQLLAAEEKVRHLKEMIAKERTVQEEGPEEEHECNEVEVAGFQGG